MSKLHFFKTNIIQFEPKDIYHYQPEAWHCLSKTRCLSFDCRHLYQADRDVSNLKTHKHPTNYHLSSLKRKKKKNYKEHGAKTHSRHMLHDVMPTTRQLPGSNRLIGTRYTSQQATLILLFCKSYLACVTLAVNQEENFIKCRKLWMTLAETSDFFDPRDIIIYTDAASLSQLLLPGFSTMNFFYFGTCETISANVDSCLLFFSPIFMQEKRVTTSLKAYFSPISPNSNTDIANMFKI